MNAVCAACEHFDGFLGYPVEMAESRADIYCDHCQDFVSHATYYRHCRLRRRNTDESDEVRRAGPVVINLHFSTQPGYSSVFCVAPHHVVIKP